MAADRTLMAWIRTSLSMLSFGFTIYKVLEAFQSESKRPVLHPHAPQIAGLYLAGMGTVAMVMGTIEFFHTMRTLNQLESFRITRPSLVMSLILSVSGVALFFGIAFNAL